MLDPQLETVAAKLNMRGELSVQRLGQGLSNHTWLVRGADDAVVVRERQPLHGTRRLRPEFEISLWRAAAARNLAPEIRWADIAQGVVVAEFLGDARCWTDQDFSNHRNWPRLSRLLTRFNELGHPLPRYSPLTAAQAYTVVSLSEALSPWEQEHRDELLSLAAQHERDNAATVICHNDLVPANVLELPGGGLRLIDFEYAGRGHPVFDWATIGAFGDLSGSGRAELLKVMSRDTVLRPEAFPAAIRLVRLLAYFWAQMELHKRPEDTGLAALRNRMRAALG
jgi:thiamine kinase